MGLGPYPEVGLADARERALDARRQIKRDGKDPIAERGRAKIKSFNEAAEALIESKRAGWRNAKHRAQWGSTLRTYAYPKLGALAGCGKRVVIWG
jgi:predicted Zn-dependent protease